MIQNTDAYSGVCGRTQRTNECIHPEVLRSCMPCQHPRRTRNEMWTDTIDILPLASHWGAQEVTRKVHG